MENSPRATKKVRRQEEDPPDEGGCHTPMENYAPKVVSFRDMVKNSSHGDDLKKDSWADDDIELQDGDVRKEVIDRVPSIDFFDRRKLLVVKLLGRKIRYNAPWNKVCDLWKPTMRFQLMDIVNNYSFEDYMNVSPKGPWVVFSATMVTPILTLANFSALCCCMDTHPKAIKKLV
ncbi:hypothetical protein Gogos_020708 [Gossypium gossypioides]|uniref:DUF4283 domain-containing protein n=1 Tax=Gossypium gossypioides TaxID=34282 RepID=A0A7J9D7U3_GOSGO|nr:hypothetical protein [Gossypium gossypioides]